MGGLERKKKSMLFEALSLLKENYLIGYSKILEEAKTYKDNKLHLYFISMEKHQYCVLFFLIIV